MPRFFSLSGNSTKDDCKALEAAVGRMPELLQSETERTWPRIPTMLKGQDAIALVAEESGFCAGFCKAHYNDTGISAVIDILYVMPDFRQRGLGRTLLMRIENMSAARGATIIRFPTATDPACAHLAVNAGYTVEAAESVSCTSIKLATTHAVVFRKTLSAAAGEM